MKPFTRALGWLAIVALAWSAYEGRAVWNAAAPLRSPAVPQGMLDLELPRNDADARRIVDLWTCAPPAPTACQPASAQAIFAIARDYRFIASYVIAWILVTWWAAAATAAPGWVVALIAGAMVAAGLSNLAEIRLLHAQLGASAIPAVVGHYAAGVTRTLAMSKFVFGLCGVLGALTLVGGAWRLRASERSIDRRRAGGEVIPPENRPGAEAGRLDRFKALIAMENGGIFTDPGARGADFPILEENRPADEPWIAFRAADVMGLALSGGGIRSATFNLGLLEGLHRLDLLRLFDYLSTVSGGGYVGGFWSEWMARRRDKLPPLAHETDESRQRRTVPPEELFPPIRRQAPPPGTTIESDPERHLREFSEFLAPRWGFFEVETWTALVAAFAGLLPAMVLACAVIAVLLVAWLGLSFPLACASPAAPLPFLGLATVFTLGVLEYMWQSIKVAPQRGAADEDAEIGWRYLAFSLVGLVVVLAIQTSVPFLYLAASGRWFGRVHSALPVFVGHWQAAIGDGGFERWWMVAGISGDRHQWVVSPRMFDFGLVWIASAVLLIGARLGYAVWPEICRRDTLATFDRVVMRLLGLGVLWCTIALVWHLAVNIDRATMALAAAVASGGTFAALRNWIGEAFRRPRDGGWFDSVRPYLPMLLAYVTVVLMIGLVGHALILIGGSNWFYWWAASGAAAFVLVVALFINPAEYGLHAFYRERITRAYSGASNLADDQHADQNRQTEPRKGDDHRLSRLVARPLHLVCCAANDLSGDPVSTLSRGARSAVLSKYGLTMGRHWASRHDLRLGSAITASAAAFNSNMGKVSLELGPAVSFLMTALNLRLGLWLRHPAATEPDRRRWPGLLLYREMFGWTSATGTIADGGTVPVLQRDVHLSDGGHFENLALYELIRRHCRYILLSDCGADPEVAFDGLGNALRRVREDFGVDITLDVAPLRPGEDQWSRQHVAIGTIHYSDTDIGVLLYVKPTLTGEEPPDVLQYKTRNRAFPHESTGDQFYDEAQWESYRRLGLHIVDEIFDFVAARVRPVTGDWLFAEAAHRWGPTPPGLRERALQMSERWDEAESALRLLASPDLMAEVFPETAILAGSSAGGQAPRAQAPNQQGDGSLDLIVLLRTMQRMEDVWLACDLDQWWDHPLNLGWVNVFARWATAPSFRFWWPVVSPMFSPGFRGFIERRFPTPTVTTGQGGPLAGIPQRGRVLPLVPGGPGQQQLTEVWWSERSTQPLNWTNKHLFQNVLDLRHPDKRVVPLQAGIAAVTVQPGTSRDTSHAGWTSDDFFVPPSLWGAGIGWYFLDNLLRVLAPAFVDCYVVVKAPPEDSRTQVAIDDYRSFVEQYRKMGFRQRLRGEPDAGPLDETLIATLGYREEEDTLLVLDLARWVQRTPAEQQRQELGRQQLD